MNRSRFFFGLTAGFLAIASAIAAKVNHFSSTPAWMYIPAAVADDHIDHCYAIQTLCIYNNSASNPNTCKKSVILSNYSVYTTAFLGIGCLHKFVYTKTGEKQ